MTVRSPSGPFGGAWRTWTCAGSGPATSTPPRTRTAPRKRGYRAAPQAGRARCRDPLRGRDDLALVPAAARHVGLSGRAGRGADHRPERQARPVRGDQLPDRTSDHPATVAVAPGGLPGVPEVAPPALRRPAALPPAGQGPLP